MRKKFAISVFLSCLFLNSAICAQENSKASQPMPFFTGADLSYVNEMEDCGGTYRDRGKKKDPFAIFASYGTDIVRVRIWHNATWTKYSNFDDVAKTIRRAKENNMRVLLDFHYSDTWTDPHRQEIPDAWKDIKTTPELAKALYDYTQETLQKLNELKLTPDMVQVGNETNVEIMQPKDKTTGETMNWERNAALLNSGIKAVRDFSQKTQKNISIILHIAQPENGLYWFPQAAMHGITDYDIMGLSYYPQWSKYKVDTIGDAIRELTKSQGKPVMVVETGYAWTLKNFDKASNVMWKESVLPDYPATPNGQRDYLIALGKAIKNSGGIGLIYWEPAWITTKCKTLWGQGSHWENGAFFDARKGNQSLPAFEFFQAF
ncbi:MAG: glycosyl hydrolase 53 family protein [Cellvibrio sp.]